MDPDRRLHLGERLVRPAGDDAARCASAEEVVTGCHFGPRATWRLGSSRVAPSTVAVVTPSDSPAPKRAVVTYPASQVRSDGHGRETLAGKPLERARRQRRTDVSTVGSGAAVLSLA